MTAISVVSAVLERLKYLEGDDNNPNLLLELKEEVGMLRTELENAKHVLVIAEGNRNESDHVPEAERQITWQFYYCEDAIETYVEETIHGRNRLKDLMKTPKRKSQRNIRNLITKIQELSEKCKGTPESSHNRSSGENSDLVHLNKSESLIRRPEDTPIETEGLIHVEQKIKCVLNSVERNLPIICIWGPGGSGKTTLAKKMYEDAKTAGSFERFAWVYIPLGFETKSMLQNILIQLCVHSKEEIMEMEDVALAQMLYKVMQQKKCLIALDDLWAVDVWQSVRIAFPFRETDSKVLLTTRDKGVAEEAASSERAYKMLPLSTKESWDLFMKKAKFSCEGELGLTQEMKEIGMEIVDCCAGSPLGVVIISELLKTKDFGEWQRVLNALKHIEDQSFEQKLGRVLALSYSRLPHYLKTSFLYLGLFPDKKGIRVETLNLLWMAEGLIPLTDSRKEKEMDKTELFLYELAKRSLLEVEEEEEPKFRNFKSCRFHDLVRDLCIKKGKEEEFFEAVGDGNGSKPSSTPRLAIHLNKFEDGSCTLDKSKVRSLLLFETQNSQEISSWPPELSDLNDFEFLRILHFDGVDFKARNLQKGLDKLTYLRYLSFLGCNLEKLPSYISNLVYLQTLDLRVKRKMTIHNELSKMKRLKNLYFPVIYVNEGSGKLSMDGLIELEILENFDTRVCNALDLSNFKKLRILKVIADGNIDDLNVIIKCMDDNTSGLQLSFLDLRNFDCYSNERVSFIQSLPSHAALHILHVQGYMGNFPKKLPISKYFIEVALDGSELKEDPMPILGKLPSLRSLILTNDAFIGKQMECSAGSSIFPKLKTLQLLNLNYLETWNVVEGSMQELSTLTIENCCNFVMLPPGMKYIESLKELKIVFMSKQFNDTVHLVYANKVNDAASSGFLHRPAIIFEY